MGVVDPLVERTLDELAPPRPEPNRWDEIVAAANRPRRRRRITAVLVPAAVVGAVALAVLAWPFGGGTHGTFLQRAAAAIGDGPVLHVVVQDGFSATQTDLATGAQTVIHQQDEYWYDPAQGIRERTTFAGVVQSDISYPPARVSYLDKTLAFLATDYRTALQNGTARVLSDGTVDGAPVYWIRVDTQMLPDVSDGKLHAWAHDVAVSQSTLKPVATRETRDGQLSPDGISRIESIESLASGSATIAPSPRSPMVGSFERTGNLTTAEASTELGTDVLTAGDSLDGLRLVRIAKDLNVANGVSYTGVTLFYGAASGGGIGTPPPAGAYLQITESLHPAGNFQEGVADYTPPNGTVVTVGPSIGFMLSHGVHVAFDASSESLILDAAKALGP